MRQLPLRFDFLIASLTPLVIAVNHGHDRQHGPGRRTRRIESAAGQYERAPHRFLAVGLG
jgi:hypothetical protein